MLSLFGYTSNFMETEKSSLSSATLSGSIATIFYRYSLVMTWEIYHPVLQVGSFVFSSFYRSAWIPAEFVTKRIVSLFGYG